ncbi:hypothetical protein GGR56DRAFT_289427 [Xylariaceae sp. FL0804]|nr:hypothetical protein GGR56DRAFT_289427 [Xylariaceae sp. FL0804]
MDAQNAGEPSNTKLPASPTRGDAQLDDPNSRPMPSATTDDPKPTVNTQPPSGAGEPKLAVAASASASAVAQDDGAGHDQNSDAETIVLPGKDGVSPSKPRKVIKHEDKSDGEVEDASASPRPRKPLKTARSDERSGPSAEHASVTSLLARTKGLAEQDKHSRSKDGSSGLSSAPASPPPHHHRKQEPSQQRRRLGDANSDSGSDSAKSQPQKAHKDRPKTLDRQNSARRKTIKTESGDESEARKVRRPRIPDTGLDAAAGAKERDQKSSNRYPDKQSGARDRSLSPPGRPHRRSLSTQLPSQSSNTIYTKKRRPAPLQSTDYQSDDSSASGSPHPRSSRLKSIATPLTGESTISPAKMPAHRKHVDNHGQTLFAKACAKGEYDKAKKWLTEWPDDLNFADYAGNTPLQVASLNGHEDIVQLLVEAGCNLDCRNSDKETPLLDAVENGHLGVVKLLLAAGVNPRKADAEGHEPLEKVPDDLENAQEIRAALREAKARVGELRRTSEDHQPQDVPDTLSSHELDSPRRSPAATAGGILASQRRGGTVRSTKTSNHLLYMNLDEKTLRQAAARGDNETVTRVLQVKEHCDDPEALVNAARGGHSVVVNLLLALGGANPDPRPVQGLPVEHGTPMLAAIGQENVEVIKLLLSQTRFDPTRRYKGQTYYEVARRREGPNWKEEEHVLKNAYDEAKKSKGSSKAKVSPKPKLVEPEGPAASSDGEAVKPRRKLISGKDLKGQREKQRRASMASNHSVSDRGDMKSEDATEKARPDRLSEKYHDRTKALKRGESTEQLADDNEAPVKRRKLDVESREKRHLQPPSPDNRQGKRDASREPAKRRRSPELERKESLNARNIHRERREAAVSSPLEKNSITVASEEPDVEMRDAPSQISSEDQQAQIEREYQEAKRRQAEAAAEAAAAEETKRKEAEQQQRQEREAEAKRKEEEAKRKEEELKRKEEEEKARILQEQKQREERERKEQEERERKQREEEERKQKEEEERKQREEEERIRREREAAEEARRLREEEERKERDRKREERAAQIHRARQEEEERRRLARMPPLLRWLECCPDPKQQQFAELFSPAQGVRYDTIDISATGEPDGRDQWLLNTQVALLFGEKDLSLSRYTAWKRIPVSRLAKRVIWGLEQDRYALTAGALYQLGQQLPDFYGGDPNAVGSIRLNQIRGEAAQHFFETDMFFVKVSSARGHSIRRNKADNVHRSPIFSTWYLPFLIFAMSGSRSAIGNCPRPRPIGGNGGVRQSTSKTLIGRAVAGATLHPGTSTTSTDSSLARTSL